MRTNRVIDAIKSAELIVHKLLAIKPGEEVVIIGDPETDIEMMQALAGVVQSVGAEYTLAIMPTRSKENSLSMTKFIDKGLEAADVVIGITAASGAACYAEVMRKLRKETGLRKFSMVLRNLDIWTRGGATADYDELLKVGIRLRDVWARGEEIYLSSPKGTDLKAKLGQAPPFIEAGFATGPGDGAAFSDGEVSLGPNEGTAEGVVVIDGPIAHIGQPAAPLRLEFQKGRLVKISGDEKAAKQLQDIISAVKDAENFAEVGIGINPNCRQNGEFEEEKKRLGNVHIAIGKNTGRYGGSVAANIHLDMVFYNGTVKTDKDTLLQDGKLVA
jgi:leucyl aminopeptidase (aminopeptidase T)